jgi:hypothetical protein
LPQPVAENKASAAAISASIPKLFFIVVKSPTAQNSQPLGNINIPGCT